MGHDQGSVYTLRNCQTKFLSIRKKERARRPGYVHVTMAPRESCDDTSGFSIFTFFLLSEVCISLLEWFPILNLEVLVIFFFCRKVTQVIWLSALLETEAVYFFLPIHILSTYYMQCNYNPWQRNINAIYYLPPRNWEEKRSIIQ